MILKSNANFPRNSCQWSLAKTNTLRLASRQLFKRGTNLQNPTHKICEIYYADEGYILCQLDQAGAEALIVAYLCRHGNFRDLFLNGVKPHVYVAMHLFFKEWQEEVLNPLGDDIQKYLAAKISDLVLLPNWKLLRSTIQNSGKRYHLGKMACHAFNYKLEAPSFVDHCLEKSEGKLIITLDQAKLYRGIYLSLFSEIPEWWQKTEDQLKETRTLRNLFGFPRTFTHRWDYSFVKEAIAFVPQSTVGCITNMATVEWQEYVEYYDRPWHLLNNKHDSFLTECPIDHRQENLKVMRDFIEKDLVAPDGTKFKMRSGAQVGYNWGEYDPKKPEENPGGMYDPNAEDSPYKLAA
jgi:hypothetical protein